MLSDKSDDLHYEVLVRRSRYSLFTPDATACISPSCHQCYFAPNCEGWHVQLSLTHCILA